MSGPAAALSSIVKAYDIRGVVGEQLTPEIVRAVGGAFARFAGAPARGVVIAHDMRDSSPGLSAAMAAGVTEAGLDVIDIGLAFDGDADRCFVVDERGEPVSASAITALVALRELPGDSGPPCCTT